MDEKKQQLINSINTEHNVLALIEYLDNYRTKDSDIDYFLTSFQKIEKTIKPYNSHYSKFYVEYIRAYTIAIKRDVIENTKETREEVERVIEIAFKNNNNLKRASYLYAARFYHLMYERHIEEYIDKKDKILLYYTTSENLGSTYAKKEKQTFIKLINKQAVSKSKSLAPMFDINLINTKNDLTKLTSKLEKSTLPFTMLISGPSGTGKSYYLRYLASKMKMNVIEKTAAELFSRYQGEPAKNVLNLFKEAEEQNAIIILDEIEKITQ